MTKSSPREGAGGGNATSSRTATSHESRADQLARLREMAYEPEGTWDLSANDRGAIASVLMQREQLIAALKVAADEVARYGHGSIAQELRAVIAKAEGRA
jgi:hypothetical protein